MWPLWPATFRRLFKWKVKRFYIKELFFRLKKTGWPLESGGTKKSGGHQSNILTLAFTGATRSAERRCQSSTQSETKWRNRIVGKFCAKTNKSVSGKVKKTLCQNCVKQTLNRVRLLVTAYQRRMSFGRNRTIVYHNKWSLKHSANMRANAIGIRARYAPCVSRLKLSSFSFSAILIPHHQINYF